MNFPIHRISPYDTVTKWVHDFTKLKGRLMPRRSEVAHKQNEIDALIDGSGHIRIVVHEGDGTIELCAGSIVGYILLSYAIGNIPRENLPDWAFIEDAVHAFKRRSEMITFETEESAQRAQARFDAAEALRAADECD